MKKTLLVVLIASFFILVLLLLILKVTGLVGATSSPAPATGPTIVGTIAPAVPASAATMPVATTKGTAVTVQNFTQQPGTSEVSGAEPYYYLANTGAPGVTEPYTITYDWNTQTFYLIIRQSPVGKYRMLAEQSLLQALGITPTQACALRSFVVTTPGADDTYLHQNLGFSFCPDAVKLPS